MLTFEKIKEQALILGFSDCGVSLASHLSQEDKHVTEWLDSGYNAKMSYMSNHFDKRLNPQLLVEGARSVISVLFSYNTQDPSVKEMNPKVSRYALGNDYHPELRDRLNSLLQFMQQYDPDIEGRAFTDSAPVLDRAWAVRAGLGWIGKSSMFISKQLGTYTFIGELITNYLPQEEIPDTSSNFGEYCGSCTACIDSCPTGAIVSPKVIDSNRCISYLTIEHKGDLPNDLKGVVKDAIYGCDICQDVCPWNRRAKVVDISTLDPISELKSFDYERWISIEREEFNSIFRSSPIRRTGFDRIKRNLKYIL